jgi:PAS domain S-box-containing protein
MAFTSSSDAMSSLVRPGQCQEMSEGKCIHVDERAKIVVDLEGRIVDWSLEAQALTGFRRNDVMGLSFVDKILTQDVQELVEAFIDDVVNGKPVQPLFVVLYSLSGVPFFVDLSVELRHGENGNHEGVMIFCSPVGGKKRAQEMDSLMAPTTADLNNYCGDCDDDDSEYGDVELDAMGTNNDLDNALDDDNSRATIPETHGGQIKIGLDSQGQIVEWAGDAEAITLFASKSVLGLHFVQKLLCIDGQAKVASCITDAFSGKAGQCCLVPFYTLTGDELTISFSIAPSFDESRAVTGVALTGEAHLR